MLSTKTKPINNNTTSTNSTQTITDDDATGRGRATCCPALPHGSSATPAPVADRQRPLIRNDDPAHVHC
ncbi:MAG TPA: hypothetical protein VGX23_27070 [Actinocrinis sp.]|nr:hypothetical protein [Actinocrinis sp.]